ncbi:MAG: ABA4-like family protein [bacterium]|jgi:hypothetical protein
MMTLDLAFKLSNNLAMIGWILLLALPRWKWTVKLVTGIVVTILAVLYVVFVVQALSPEEMKSFGTLEGIMELFTDKGAVLAGWIHYLAFDLMVGVFIVTNAIRNKISHWLVIPCLLLTFMLGPTGLLIYLVIRMVKTRSYFLATESIQ